MGTVYVDSSVKACAGAGQGMCARTALAGLGEGGVLSPWINGKFIIEIGQRIYNWHCKKMTFPVTLEIGNVEVEVETAMLGSPRCLVELTAINGNSKQRVKETCWHVPSPSEITSPPPTFSQLHFHNSIHSLEVEVGNGGARRWFAREGQWFTAMKSRDWRRSWTSRDLVRIEEIFKKYPQIQELKSWNMGSSNSFTFFKVLYLFGS